MPDQRADREPGAEPRRFSLTYDVSPSAEDTTRVVVSADTDTLHGFARREIDAALDRASQQKILAQDAATADQARRQLLATIKPKWLVGTWIATTDDAVSCATGNGIEFLTNHSAASHTLNARWALRDNKLHIVGSMPGKAVDETLIITDADSLSFRYEGTQQGSFRRCTFEEIARHDPTIDYNGM